MIVTTEKQYYIVITILVYILYYIMPIVIIINVILSYYDQLYRCIQYQTHYDIMSHVMPHIIYAIYLVLMQIIKITLIIIILLIQSNNNNNHQMNVSDILIYYICFRQNNISNIINTISRAFLAIEFIICLYIGHCYIDMCIIKVILYIQ